MVISNGEAITLSGSTTLSSIGAGADGNDGDITLGGTVNSSTDNSDRTLTVNVGQGDFLISGAVGGTTDRELGAIDINNSGTGNFDLNAVITGAASIDVAGLSNLGKGVTTSGDQVYNGNATISGNTGINFTGGTVSFLGTVAGDGGNDEAVTITGDAIFGNATTDTVTGLKSLVVTGDTTIETTTITTVDTQTYGDTANSDTLTLGTNVVMTTGTAAGDDITFNSILNDNGADERNLTVTAEDVIFNAVVGTTNDLGAIDITGGVGVRLLAELAGHSHISTTQRYIDVNAEQLSEAVELL